MKKFNKITNILIILIAIGSAIYKQPWKNLLPPHTEIKNFMQAKAVAAQIHQKQNSHTFYCDCPIQWHGKKGKVDLAACGYQIRHNPQRAKRVEWEHVMPAWYFGHNLQCWQKGGRKACENNPQYVKIETDLHNLQPSIGEVNSDRHNFMFSQWQDHGDETHYNSCHLKIDFVHRQVEPPARIRGVIARTYFYMRDRYHLPLSKKQTKLLSIWDKQNPVTLDECQRNQTIAEIQGNDNPYVTKACHKFDED